MRYAMITAAVFLLGGCKEPTPQTPAASAPQPTPSPVGRYAIVHSPHVERDTVLLDTVTGRTWQLVTFSDIQNDPAGWTPMAREDHADEMEALRASNPQKPKTTAPKVEPSPPKYVPSWARGSNESD